VDVAVDPHPRVRRPRVGAAISPVLGAGFRRPAALGRAHLDSPGGRRSMTIVGRFLCRIGVHRWLRKRNPEGGETYRECERCQKQKTITLSDTGYDGGIG
jgi:hypothetical protein